MSYTKITFCGLNVARLLNYLCKSGLNVLSVTKCGQTCTVVVNHRDKKRLLDVLNDRCYTVTQVQNFGGTTCLTFAKRHFVLLVAILLMVVGCGILSNHCCKIVVTGDVDADIVVAQMDTLGVNVGANLKDVNIDHLENALATRLDVMYAVVTRKGAVLYVDTIAKKQIDAPIDMHKRRDIVATCDGVVQSVLCEQGTPIVKVGDVVKAGDVLIEGTRRFNDDTREDVYALGKVVLVQSVSAFVPYTGTKTELQPTGNCQTFTQVVLFGKT
ncbi:MAG: sporulation protein YqfD, partial [Clostridia bacterium]|nr:sporulation protein YqfD [Clostridia bacterium]